MCIFITRGDMLTMEQGLTKFVLRVRCFWSAIEPRISFALDIHAFLTLLLHSTHRFIRISPFSFPATLFTSSSHLRYRYPNQSSNHYY